MAIETYQASRGRLFETHSGTHTHAFGAREWLLLASIALIWGASFFLIDIGLRAFAPSVIAMARVGLGALTLAALPAARRSIERRDMPRVAMLGVVWMGIPLILFPVAQQWIDSSVAGMLNAAVPLAAGAWASLLLGRLPRRNQALGLLIGFAGVLAISLPELRGAQASALGVTLVLLAVILYGLSQNLAVPLQQKYGAPPVLLRALGTALFIVVPFGLLGLDDSTWAWGPALAMLPLGVLGTGLAYVLMTTLVGRVGAARGSIAIYFVPIVAISLGVAFLGESVGITAIAGTALVLAGAWLTSRRSS